MVLLVHVGSGKYSRITAFDGDYFLLILLHT